MLSAVGDPDVGIQEPGRRRRGGVRVQGPRRRASRPRPCRDPKGATARGSHRRPMSKKRFRKIRCYNCGEFANHIAAKCTMGPQPKRCHQCKSTEHLIADCPQREDKKGHQSRRRCCACDDDRDNVAANAAREHERR
ncbi:hypothetical protein MRX96_020162 [Rhipicephalus microplus]